jgi:hypothetical protein
MAAAPYWVLLPGWLGDAESLEDILWAQYLLFLAVRVQDDLYDGQAAGSPLIYAANLLFVEADRTLDDRFAGDAAIRRVVRHSIETTTRAIVEVDARQRTPAGFGRDDLPAYARVAEVFKVGATAACMKLRRSGELTAVGRYCDALAIAGQILDDLSDVEEDLRDGRLNFASTVLLGEDGACDSLEKKLKKIGQGLLLEERTSLLMSEVRGQLDHAAAAAASLRLAQASDYVDDIRRRTESVEIDLHDARVDAVVSSLKSRSSR